MRIIAGRWRGRRIASPAGDRVRPTGDRVREAWMSIMSPWLPDARVLDLFAGTGALGLEALSRGAAFVDFVDDTPASLDLLRDNIDSLQAHASCAVHKGDALRFAATLEARSFDVVVADPPYDAGIATRLAEQWLATPFSTILAVEHRANEVLPGDGDRRRYGGTVLTFFGLKP